MHSSGRSNVVVALRVAGDAAKAEILEVVNYLQFCERIGLDFEGDQRSTIFAAALTDTFNVTSIVSIRDGDMCGPRGGGWLMIGGRVSSGQSIASHKRNVERGGSGHPRVAYKLSNHSSARHIA